MPKGTDRQVDRHNVGLDVVLEHGGLDLPAPVGQVHPLTAQQGADGGHAGKAGPDQFTLSKLADFATVVKLDQVSVFQGAALGGLDDGGVEAAVDAGGHHPGAQDGPFGDPLAGRHGGREGGGARRKRCLGEEQQRLQISCLPMPVQRCPV